MWSVLLRRFPVECSLLHLIHSVGRWFLLIFCPWALSVTFGLLRHDFCTGNFSVSSNCASFFMASCAWPSYSVIYLSGYQKMIMNVRFRSHVLIIFPSRMYKKVTSQWEILRRWADPCDKEIFFFLFSGRGRGWEEVWPCRLRQRSGGALGERHCAEKP